jgi:drug/metabolite transporter (DMT)-like permease
VFGYASANLFDRWAVSEADADPLVGPLLRGLPSLALGIALVWKNRTFGQLRRSSTQYIGRKTIGSLLAAGFLSTLGLFAYYFAVLEGGIVITAPVQETYVIWGTLIAWFFLHERFHGFVMTGVALICAGLVLLSLGETLRGGPQSHAGMVSPHWYWAIPLAVFTSLTYGVSGVLWRYGQLRGAHQSVAILLQFATSILVAVAGLAITERLGLLVQTSLRAISALLTSGVLSGIIAIYCIFTALRLMEVARVYALTSLTPVVATLAAHFLLHEYLNLPMLGGVVLVSIGVALTQTFRRTATVEDPVEGASQKLDHI